MLKPGSGCADAAREPVRSVSPLAFVLRIGVLTRAGTGDGALVVLVDAASEAFAGMFAVAAAGAVAVGCWWVLVCLLAVSLSSCQDKGWTWGASGAKGESGAYGGLISRQI